MCKGKAVKVGPESNSPPLLSIEQYRRPENVTNNIYDDGSCLSIWRMLTLFVESISCRVQCRCMYYSRSFCWYRWKHNKPWDIMTLWNSLRIFTRVQMDIPENDIINLSYHHGRECHLARRKSGDQGSRSKFTKEIRVSQDYAGFLGLCLFEARLPTVGKLPAVDNHPLVRTLLHLSSW